MQQKMMKFMPIMIAFFFYNMPAGLVLYFVTSSLYTLMEHYFIKRKLDAEDPPAGTTSVATSTGSTSSAVPSGTMANATPAIAGAGAGVSSPSGKSRKKRKKKKR